MPVVNVRSGDRYDVRIDRGTCWGNRYVVGRDGNLARCLELYRQDVFSWLASGELTIEGLAALDGLRLGCHCAPAPCHGDVLEEMAAAARMLVG